MASLHTSDWNFQHPKDAIDWRKVKRVLVIKLRHHGDVLLTTPLLSSLKQLNPQLDIDALVYTDTMPMLMGNPALRMIHGIDKRWKKLPWFTRLRREYKLWHSLKQQRYDLILHLTENNRGMWLVRSLKPRWSATYKGGHVTLLWKRTFTHLVPQPIGPAGARRHTVEKHLDVLRRLGANLSEQPAPLRRLQIVPGERATDVITTTLAAVQFDEKQFIHVHPASRWFFKCWSVEKNSLLLDKLFERGERIVLTAAPDSKESAMIDAILDQLETPRHILEKRFLNLSGQLTLREMAALTARAKAFIGVDSAPMHIAAAVQTPAVVLFGPSGELEWGPWQSPHRLITSQEYACRPCGIDGCGGGKVSDCLATLPVSRVMRALDDLLAQS
ncbi:putative lipopolysaccharide heptosyltransferase III [Parvibium lacunae]|uniref:Putative lipopolysaccharide heptosyltransferase III n=1 Tax=Parvibium lacunae TaxID=1888893 RepID=A0A368L4C7_9BURK|nr:putative lipopolysaccharide heptosyltransferase III [Parvibium lacunae]RCS58424.1 putative lipopolysaccharide heptosyltransferase III [Parvibium lacunae]